MGRAGPEAHPGPVEPHAAEFRREPCARQPRRGPEKGGAPDPRRDGTERHLVECLGWRRQGDRVGWTLDPADRQWLQRGSGGPYRRRGFTV